MAMNGDRKTNIFGKLVRFGKLVSGEEGEREGRRPESNEVQNRLVFIGASLVFSVLFVLL